MPSRGVPLGHHPSLLASGMEEGAVKHQSEVCFEGVPSASNSPSLLPAKSSSFSLLKTLLEASHPSGRPPAAHEQAGRQAGRWVSRQAGEQGGASRVGSFQASGEEVW